MQTKCPKCSTAVKSNGSDWEIIGGPCVDLAGTHWLLYAEYCPTLSKIAEPDVLLPGATDMPPIHILHSQTPSPLNPLGMKGAGEGGTIPAIAAIIAAVENALVPFEIRINEAPISPARIAELVRKAR